MDNSENTTGSVVQSEEDSDSLLYTLRQKEMTDNLVEKIVSSQPKSKLMCNETSKLLALKQELSKVDKELETKKKEVCDRLKVTEERKEALQKKQEELIKRMKKFSEVIEEGKIVRYKALQRKCEEEKELRAKENEVAQLRKQLAFLRKRNKGIVDDCEQYKAGETYLEEVYHAAPTGYFDGNDVPAQAVISRMNALMSNRKQLQKELTDKTDEVIKVKSEVKQLEQEHEETMMYQYGKLSDLKKKYEEKKNANIAKEQQLYKSLSQQREKNQELYKILSAVDNLSTTCHAAMPSSKVRVTTATNPVNAKLKSVQDFIQHKTTVVNHVKLELRQEMEGRVTDMRKKSASANKETQETQGIASTISLKSSNTTESSFNA